MIDLSRYNDLAVAISTDTGADDVVILITGGKAGNGCCRAVNASSAASAAELDATMVRKLRTLADSIERASGPRPTLQHVVRGRGAPS